MTTSRDLLNHGPGKGDKPRSKFDRRWHQNFSEIKMPPKSWEGWTKIGSRKVKRYG